MTPRKASSLEAIPHSLAVGLVRALAPYTHLPNAQPPPVPAGVR